jgi:hypothetical protein
MTPYNALLMIQIEMKLYFSTTWYDHYDEIDVDNDVVWFDVRMDRLFFPSCKFK